MGVKSILKDSTVAHYVKVVKESPRELIVNRHLLLTVAFYAMGGIPLCEFLFDIPRMQNTSIETYQFIIGWDQGSSSVVTSLPGFQKAFGLSSATNPTEIANFVSFVYIGAGVGSGLSFFTNDRLGRLWSMRLYLAIWTIGQFIAMFASGNLAALYAARIVSGMGIGALTVIGPVGIVEVAPTEFRGLLAVWFSVAMLLSLTLSCLVVLASYLHVAAGPMQYQLVFFTPLILMALAVAASFFLCYESPRWLFVVGRKDDAVKTLVTLRGLPATHPRVSSELEAIQTELDSQKSVRSGFVAATKETFLVPSNLRRLQQAILSYLLAQLSGANSVTSYLVPILNMVGVQGGTEKSLFLTSMYSMAKFFFTLMASFFFIDALGRRRSLFLGITIQMISDIYLGAFIKYKQEGSVSASAGQAGIAMIFIHGFGFAIGLLVLPYVFHAELWPNQIRSYGASMTQFCHWLFYFGINKGMPPLLSSTNNWGAFLFFAGWCFIALFYTFFVVPETSGASLEDLNSLFEQPIWKAYQTSKKFNRPTDIEARDTE
ncbi:hypothetical protein FQN55_002185 [Onygenales sp. PD_40]|nr:hypothetical protein FQN55_002185 [Onygenales sp. PD_40]